LCCIQQQPLHGHLLAGSGCSCWLALVDTSTAACTVHIPMHPQVRDAAGVSWLEVVSWFHYHSFVTCTTSVTCLMLPQRLLLLLLTLT
jgi:hypothetical protein